MIFSKKVWDSLTPAEKKIIDESSDEAVKAQREAARGAVARNLDLLRQNGMTVSQFPAAEVAKLRAKMQPVIAKYSANVGEATVNELMGELSKLLK